MEQPWQYEEREAEEARRERREVRRERFLEGPYKLPSCRMPGCEHPVQNRETICIACQVKSEREKDASTEMR